MRSRIQILFLLILIFTGVIVLRLAYWQIVKGPTLRAEARDQYSAREVSDPGRGSIVTADGFPLVINRPEYALGVYTPGFSHSYTELIDRVVPLLSFPLDDPFIATHTGRTLAYLEEQRQLSRSVMQTRLDKGGYAVLASGLTEPIKNQIEALNIPGLTFDQTFVRSYPEASMSAHLTGFVGRDDVGSPLGYFGLEGFYDRELSARARVEKQEKDGLGHPLLSGDWELMPGRPGRSLELYLERGAQFLVEQELKKGLERYGAVSGEVIVMDPTTGGILAMASLPSYDQHKFHLFETTLYKNPSIANTYEPGSTFKVLVAAAALNENAVTESDHCDQCEGPLTIGDYNIKTWDNQYRPGATLEEILVHSDNTGMVWLEQQLGGEKMVEYLRRFGLGSKTGIDLQEEVASPLRSRWGDIDYATSSFGQGIAVTSIQMVTAVSAIANGGTLLEPHVVKNVLGDTPIPLPIKNKGQVITPETAKRITNLMVAAVEKGEAKWAIPKGYRIAGKTGTAQIAVSGHYDAEKTIASFVGFAPAEKPRFVMLVKLREPSSSQWGSETAAPLWFRLATKLLLHYNIAPSN
ncbi:MAG: Peptidoglycan glycosyltransferase [Microgenomates group bacterium GW2011_GWF1_46_12]|nr:MAG: Peptidoglycan glycosyltransferase [Microgenomates group bacterium GW2011_GWF1_46_12]